MKTKPDISTSSQLVELQNANKKLEAENQQQRIDLAYYRQELEQLKRMIFGSKSERFTKETNTNQLSIFEEKSVSSPLKSEKEAVFYTRTKPKKIKPKGHSRPKIAEHIPRQVEYIEPEEDVSGAKKIGEEITEILEYEQGRLYARKLVRPKYAYKEQEDKGITIAPMPSLPIPHGNAGAGLLAHMQVSKFVDHLPIHRQLKQFRRGGVEIAESTANDWQKSIYKLLMPLYERLISEVLSQNYLMADESPIPVLSKNKPGSTHRGYHWVYFSPQTGLVVFDYQQGRGQEAPENFLKSFKGALQTDGYAGYNGFTKRKNIVMLACMAHARRKFEKALQEDPDKAGYALEEIKKLYLIERRANSPDGKIYPEKRGKLRQAEAVPILEGLEKWMKEEVSQTLPKSAMGKALSYALNLWDRLYRYVENGDWEIDNNLVENSIRPLALGRKNYMFAGSHKGAQRTAMFYSFFGSCQKLGIDPHTWLKDVLERIPEHKANKLHELLPHNWIQSKA